MKWVSFNKVELENLKSLTPSFQDPAEAEKHQNKIDGLMKEIKSTTRAARLYRRNRGKSTE